MMCIYFFCTRFKSFTCKLLILCNHLLIYVCCFADNLFKRQHDILFIDVFISNNNLSKLNTTNGLYNYITINFHMMNTRIKIINFACLFKTNAYYIYHSTLTFVYEALVAPLLMSDLRFSATCL